MCWGYFSQKQVSVVLSLEMYRRFDLHVGNGQKFIGKHCNMSDLWKIFDLQKIVRNLVVIFIKYIAKAAKEGGCIVDKYTVIIVIQTTHIIELF